MTREQKRAFNYENEQDYYYAPFSEQRKELRRIWNTTRKDWHSFLYDQEKKYQSKIKKNET